MLLLVNLKFFAVSDARDTAANAEGSVLPLYSVSQQKRQLVTCRWSCYTTLSHADILDVRFCFLWLFKGLEEGNRSVYSLSRGTRLALAWELYVQKILKFHFSAWRSLCTYFIIITEKLKMISHGRSPNEGNAQRLRAFWNRLVREWGFYCSTSMFLVDCRLYMYSVYSECNSENMSQLFPSMRGSYFG